jgi:hypothetical protein
MGATKVHKVTATYGMKSIYFNKKNQPAKNITAAEYEDVFDTFIQESKRLFNIQGMASCKLQQDNDPTHHKVAAKKVDVWNDAPLQGFKVRIA